MHHGLVFPFAIALSCAPATEPARSVSSDSVALPGPRPQPPVAGAPPVDAGKAPSPRAPIPPSLEAAPATVYRELIAGWIVAKTTLQTFTLRREGNLALLDVSTKTSPGNKTTHPIEWSDGGTKRYFGKVETSHRNVTLHLDAQEGGETIELTCQRGTIRAAGVTAIRKAKPVRPNSAGCDGERGHWVPAATRPVEVLRCWPPDMPADSFDPDRKETHAFATDPGVEWLYVNDDCVMQGGGYRGVASDGAVQKFR